MTRAMLGIYRNAQRPAANPDILLERGGDGYPDGVLPQIFPLLKELRDLLEMETFHCLAMELEERAGFCRQDELYWIANMQYFYRINCEEQELVVYSSRFDYAKERFRRKALIRIDLAGDFDVESPHLDKIGYYWVHYRDGSVDRYFTFSEARKIAGGDYPVFYLNDELEPIQKY